MVSVRFGHKTYNSGVKGRLNKVGGAARLGLKQSGNVAGGLGTAATLAALTGAGAPVAGGLAAVGGAIGSIGKVAGVVGAGARKAQKVDQVIGRVENANRAIDRFVG